MIALEQWTHTGRPSLNAESIPGAAHLPLPASCRFKLDPPSLAELSSRNLGTGEAAMASLLGSLFSGSSRSPGAAPTANNAALASGAPVALITHNPASDKFETGAEGLKVRPRRRPPS